MTDEVKKLYKDPKNKKIAGVCAGLSNYFGVDLTLIRVGFAASIFIALVGVVVYVLLWIFLDDEPDGTELEYV